jgi:molybdenum cofactor cytidylyltransferase
MGGEKLAAELLPGLPLAAAALRALLSVGLDGVYVVVRPGPAPQWLRQAAPAPAGGPGLTVVVCADAERGMAHSLRRGLAAAEAAGCDAAVVWLADQPFVTAAMARALIGAWRSEPRLDYVASGNGAVLTPPVLLAASTFPHIARLEGDLGAKRLLERPGFFGRVLPAEEPERLMDVDTPDALEAARQCVQNTRYLN